ncbi:hypothetical protein [Lysobacter firmicutimachus]|uniref:Uncharacterized protein n=1 Tax=Lysobacter firmicutimachus TaxID=1792846 RepID=A0ABU8CYK8_9GAMM
MSKNLAKGDEIVSLLREVSELDWARNSFSRVVYRAAQGEVAEDRSAEPPYTSFRFKSEQPGLLEALGRAVKSYTGKVDWVLVSHDRSPSAGINWTICPKLTVGLDAEIRSSGLTVQQYFRERMPEFGVSAYEDMVDFVAYLRQCTVPAC